MIHQFQVHPEEHVVPAAPRDRKFVQDGNHPLNLVVLPWTTRGATLFVNNHHTAMDPPVHPIVAKTYMSDAANAEVVRSLGRYRALSMPDIPHVRSAAVMTYDCYSFRRKQLVRNIDMIHAHEFADMWVLFGAEYDGWSVGDYFEEKGFHASAGLQLQLGDDNPGLETVWFFWMPQRVDVAFGDRDDFNSAIVVDISRHNYKDFIEKAIDQASIFPERANKMTRVD